MIANEETREMVSVLKAACDRDWADETPIQVAQIAANAIYWRDTEIARLRAELGEVAEARTSPAGARHE